MQANVDNGSFIENFDDMIVASSPTKVESSFDLTIKSLSDLTVASPIGLTVESPIDLTHTDDEYTAEVENTHMDNSKTFIDKDITVVNDTLLNCLPNNECISASWMDDVQLGPLTPSSHPLSPDPCTEFADSLLSLEKDHHDYYQHSVEITDIDRFFNEAYSEQHHHNANVEQNDVLRILHKNFPNYKVSTLVDKTVLSSCDIVEHSHYHIVVLHIIRYFFLMCMYSG